MARYSCLWHDKVGDMDKQQRSRGVQIWKSYLEKSFCERLPGHKLDDSKIRPQQVVEGYSKYRYAKFYG